MERLRSLITGVVPQLTVWPATERDAASARGAVIAAMNKQIAKANMNFKLNTPRSPISARHCAEILAIAG
jgi:hypothetical protein